jgi:CheY-like chemotaxis protein
MSDTTVLIVEDDTIARIIFKKLLSRLGYPALEAINGEEALKVLSSHPEISHVFLDLNMPVIDGYEFLRYINAGKKYNSLKVFITSVSEENEFEETVVEKRIDCKLVMGYHKKPYDMVKLATSLQAGHVF